MHYIILLLIEVKRTYTEDVRKTFYKESCRRFTLERVLSPKCTTKGTGSGSLNPKTTPLATPLLPVVLVHEIVHVWEVQMCPPK